MPKFVPYTPAFITTEAEPEFEFTAKDGWRDAPIAQRAAAMEGFSTWLKAEPDGRGRIWVRAWFAAEESKLPIGYIEPTQAELLTQAASELATIGDTLAGFADEAAYEAKQSDVNRAIGDLCKRLQALKFENTRQAALRLANTTSTPVQPDELQALRDGVAALGQTMQDELARRLAV